MATAIAVLAVPGAAPRCPLAATALQRGPACRITQHLRGVREVVPACPASASPRRASGVARVFPFDQAWAPSLNAASLAPQLFAMSLFPYLCFLFFLHKSGKAPPLTLFGFYFLLVFVGATIPAGIYAKSHYGMALANVDWLHGAAESLLTVTNLLIVLGLRQGIREAEAAKAASAQVQEPAAGGQEAAQQEAKTLQ